MRAPLPRSVASSATRAASFRPCGPGFGSVESREIPPHLPDRAAGAAARRLAVIGRCPGGITRLLDAKYRRPGSGSAPRPRSSALLAPAMPPMPAGMGVELVERFECEALRAALPGGSRARQGRHRAPPFAATTCATTARPADSRRVRPTTRRPGGRTVGRQGGFGDGEVKGDGRRHADGSPGPATLRSRHRRPPLPWSCPGHLQSAGPSRGSGGGGRKRESEVETRVPQAKADGHDAWRPIRSIALNSRWRSSNVSIRARHRSRRATANSSRASDCPYWTPVARGNTGRIGSLEIDVNNSATRPRRIFGLAKSAPLLDLREGVQSRQGEGRRGAPMPRVSARPASTSPGSRGPRAGSAVAFAR